MVTLRPVGLHWIQGRVDEPEDLCAHGHVEFRIGDDVLLDPNGKDLTLSAAALYLLRTLSVSHSRESPVGDHLFPCCGSVMWEIPEVDDVAICGCPNGEDVEVLHQDNRDGIVVRATDGRQWRLGFAEWREAVFGFADSVASFYASCSPKLPSDDHAAGFKKFCGEWERRRGRLLPAGQEL